MELPSPNLITFMKRQWDAEQTIEPHLALELIQQQFPELDARTIRFLGAGWDNTVFLIDEKLVFRFPRREIALPLLEAEWSLLPKLAPRLPLPIPFPKWRGSPTSVFPWPFIGHPMLPGTTACRAHLSDKERSALAKPIAQFLAALHATPHSLISDCPIPTDNLSRIDARKILSKIEPCLEELSSLKLFQKKLSLPSADTFRLPTATAVVHGDFYVRHLLLDEKHHLTGIIDWGDLHFGDPAIDLAIAHSFLPPQAHSLFRETYGPLSEATWQLARLRALYSSALLALYGHHSGDLTIAQEGLRYLASSSR